MGRVSIVRPPHLFPLESDAIKSVEIGACNRTIVSGGSYDYGFRCLGKFSSLSYGSWLGFQKQGSFTLVS